MSDTHQGDTIYGNKFEGDLVSGNKAGRDYYETHNYFPAEPIPDPPLEEAFAELAKLPLDSVPKPGNLPPNSRLPHSANPLFTGRIEDFKTLARTLKGQDDEDEFHAALITTAVTGLGGVGKTQLAAEFAHRYGRYFLGGVYWLSFADKAAVPAEIAACGRRMGLQGLETVEIDFQVKRVMREWEKPLPRLLIFDNCEEEALFHQYRPKIGGARVLVTSRRGRWSPGFGLTTLQLETLPRPESIQLLQQFWPPLTEEEANSIAAELGDLPLALHLAGSYLAYFEGAVTPAEFLHELNTEGPFHEALEGEIESHSPTNHERSVARTFALSYQQLEEGELAHTILIHLACFAPNKPVPLEPLLKTLNEDDKRPSQKEIMKARHNLISLGLVMVDYSQTLRLHYLLHQFVCHVIKEEVLANATNSVVRAVLKMTRTDSRNSFKIPMDLAHLNYIADIGLKNLQAHLYAKKLLPLIIAAEYLESKMNERGESINSVSAILKRYI